MNVELDFEKRYRLVREVIETIVLTVLMFLVIRLAVQNFNIDGHSMEPTLHNTELVLVDKWTYRFHTPARGDVIVFHAPPQPTQDYIKRIIGLPGDVITVQNTSVYVNGKLLTEFYVKPQNQGNPYPPITNLIIPQHDYFVLGDNRMGSSDSRDWGCVPQQSIIGRAAIVYWPLGQDNDGLLPNVTSAYDSIPASPAAQLKNTTQCHVITNPAQPYASASVLPTQHMPLDTDTALLLLMPGLFVACSYRRQHRS